MVMGARTLEITAELIPEEEGGYTVYCPELDIYTQGDTVEEALANLKEAAELHLQEIGTEGLRLRSIERRRISVEIP
jgi:predicted RNase H-like HicB family nuclease